MVGPMNLELLKQDLRVLLVQTFLCVVLVTFAGSYLIPFEIALRNPFVFFAVLGNVLYYYYKKHQRSVYRLRVGWTVRGNDIE